jgi:putative mRNA 3-end processing factor
MTSPKPESWIEVRATGLYVRPGDFHVDPTRAVDRAVITHGHADHARAGHTSVAATAETLAIMAVRYGAEPEQAKQALAPGEILKVGDVSVTLYPAGHVLGSAGFAGVQRQPRRGVRRLQASSGSDLPAV